MTIIDIRDIRIRALAAHEAEQRVLEQAAAAARADDAARRMERWQDIRAAILRDFGIDHDWSSGPLLFADDFFWLAAVEEHCGDIAVIPMCRQCGTGMDVFCEVAGLPSLGQAIAAERPHFCSPVCEKEAARDGQEKRVVAAFQMRSHGDVTKEAQAAIDGWYKRFVQDPVTIANRIAEIEHLLDEMPAQFAALTARIDALDGRMA